MFKIDSEALIDYSLRLQKINAIALPFAVQDTLNNVARDVKMRTLNISSNKHFNMKRKSFIKSNSGYKPGNAKQSGYNINRMYSEVGITKGTRAKEKATETLANQQTATPIKRGVNPLGNKPQTSSTISILSKKPEIYDSAVSYQEGNSFAYMRKAQKALRNGSGFAITKNQKGYVNRVVSIRKRKPTKKDPRKMVINIKPIASYNKGGMVKLTKPRPFLNDASIQSMTDKANSEFIKAAERQFSRAMKR